MHVSLHKLCDFAYEYTICVKHISMKEKLKLLRNQMGVSQKDVATAIGVTTSAYSNYEQGTREPSIQILANICKYYDVSADYLIGLED